MDLGMKHLMIIKCRFINYLTVLIQDTYVGSHSVSLFQVYENPGGPYSVTMEDVLDLMPPNWVLPVITLVWI